MKSLENWPGSKNLKKQNPQVKEWTKAESDFQLSFLLKVLLIF